MSDKYRLEGRNGACEHSTHPQFSMARTPCLKIF